jgi:poly(3-hydroxyalkanoate) synthetase
MDLDAIPKIRGDLFRLYARYFPALKVAAMPAETIHEDTQTGFRLLHYQSRAEATANHLRLLLVPHIINRPYILDLNEDVSVVGFLCRQGIEVFMIDWGYPEIRHRDWGRWRWVMDAQAIRRAAYEQFIEDCYR